MKKKILAQNPGMEFPFENLFVIKEYEISIIIQHDNRIGNIHLATFQCISHSSLEQHEQSTISPNNSNEILFDQQKNFFNKLFKMVAVIFSIWLKSLGQSHGIHKKYRNNNVNQWGKMDSSFLVHKKISNWDSCLWIRIFRLFFLLILRWFYFLELLHIHSLHIHKHKRK